MRRLWAGLAMAVVAGGVILAGVVVPSDEAPAAGTANLYVNVTGQTCTRSSTPITYAEALANGWVCATPSAAWTLAQGGDTILVRGGTYSAGMDLSGSKSSTVTISPVVGENAWFAGDANFSSATNVLITDTDPDRSDGITLGQTFISGSSANIAFTNIDLWCQNSSPWHIITGPSGSNCTAGFNISGLNGFTMTGGSVGPVTDCFNAPCNSVNVNTIGLCSSNSTCQNMTWNGVVFHDAYRVDDPSAHSSMWIIFQGQNLTFRNSQFIGCHGCNTGNVFFGQSASDPTPDFLTFIGNVFSDTESGGTTVSMGYRSPTTPPTVVFNYNSVVGAFLLSQGAPGGAISYANTQMIGNVISYQPGFFSFVCNGDVHDNVFGSPDTGTSVLDCGNDTTYRPFDTNAMWVTPGSPTYDLHLEAGAVAVGAGGTGCSTYSPDYDGQARPIGACDAGADER